jgi:hypothetical protein
MADSMLLQLQDQKSTPDPGRIKYTPQDPGYTSVSKNVPEGGQSSSPQMANGQTVSEAGQSAAEATGNAYKEVGKVTEPTQWTSLNTQAMNSSIPQVSSGLNYVDQDKSTVKGQLNSLLSQDSPYIQQAELAGERQAASRGMLNSSMAAGASRAEAYKAALPIAQQDAQTYAQAQNLEQQAKNAQTQTQTEAVVSSELAIQNAAIKQTQQNIQNIFTAQMQSASDQSKVFLQDFQQQHQAFEAQLDRQHQQLLQSQQISAEKSQMIRQQSSAIMQNYQISVENLMTDPDFLNLGAEALQNTISQLQALASNSINFLGASSGVDLSEFVDTYLEPIDIYT